MAGDDEDAGQVDELEQQHESVAISEQGLFDVKSHEILPKMYLSYALSVIKDRSLPDIRDGLKPVARRILFGMNEMGLTHSKPTRKSARVVGDVMGKYHPHGDGCLAGNTLATSLDGNTYEFRNLVGKRIWVLSYDDKTSTIVPAEAHSFRITKYVDKLYRITFWNNEIIELTENHELDEIIDGWKRTDEIKIGNIIANGIITANEYPKFRSANDFLSIGKKIHHIVGETIYGKAEIYHHKDENTKNNLPSNLNPMTKIEHEKIHKNYEIGLRKGNETMFHGTDEFREAIRQKNSEIIKAVNQKHYLFKAIKIVKLIIKDGLEPTQELYKQYREKIYNGTTIEKLLANGHSFEEVVGYAKSKDKLKLIETSAATGLTTKLYQTDEFYDDDEQISNDRSGQIDGHVLINAAHVATQCIEDYGLNFSIEDYENTRVDVCEMYGCGSTNINSRCYPKFETLMVRFDIKSINDLLDLLSIRNLMIVKNIEVIQVDHEPVYDFTVDKYENMYVPVGKNEKGELKLILVHNSIYGTAVRMSQPFTTRYPTIIGQGNFGSVEDEPAAMRYTEMKMSPIAEEVVADIEKQTVDFIPNYDGTLQEPKVLPTRIPLLLLNGSVGIAVGMATTVPPHNLTEIINGLLAYIDNEDITVAELMKYIKGPDFPSAAFMFDNNIQNIYETGQGSVTLRAKAEIVDNGKRQSIVITELPYQLDKSKLIARIAELYKEKKYEGIDGITDIRDESDKSGIRVVIELRRGVHAKMVLNTLFRRTELQTKYSCLMRALINNIPKLVGLKEIFWHFVNHRKAVVTRRTEFDLDQAEKRAHILKGFLIVFENLDAILVDVKTSKSVEETYKKLRKYKLSDEQIKSILELRIQRIAQFERDVIIKEHNDLIMSIEQMKKLLDSEELVVEEIKRELTEIKKKYGDNRKTQLIKTRASQNDEVEDLTGVTERIEEIEEIQNEDVIVTVTKNGLIKRTPVSEYRLQNIKGRGLIGVDIKADDYVDSVFQLSTRDYALVFTSKGKCHRMNVHEIPSLGRTASGSSILNILHLDEGENIASVVPVTTLVDRTFIMVTKLGQVKRLKAEKLQRPRTAGTKVIGLADNDELMQSILLDRLDLDVILVSHSGLSIRFETNTIRSSGKGSWGVRGIKLTDGDWIVAANVISKADNEVSYLMTVTERGYSKRSILSKFRTQRRGGQGIICMDANAIVGKVIAANVVRDDKEQFMLITTQGILIRLRAGQIRRLGRNTQGSRIQKLATSDSVAAVVFLGIVEGDEEEIKEMADGGELQEVVEDKDDDQSKDTVEEETPEDDINDNQEDKDEK